MKTPSRPGQPAPLLLRTPQDAEEQAAAWVRHLGWPEARCTPPGADGGIDVVARDAVAQVKAEQRPTGRPPVQQLYGAAAGRAALFFTIAGYTAEAIEWANDHGVALFELDLAGLLTPRNSRAAGLLAQTSDADAGGAGVISFGLQACVLAPGHAWEPPFRTTSIHLIPEEFGPVVAGAHHLGTTFVQCHHGLITIAPDGQQIDASVPLGSDGHYPGIVGVNSTGVVLEYPDGVLESWYGERQRRFSPSDVGIAKSWAEGVGGGRAAMFSKDGARLVVIDLTTGEPMVDTRAPCAPLVRGVALAGDRLVATIANDGASRRAPPYALTCVDLERCVTVWETSVRARFVPCSISDGLVAGTCYDEDDTPLGFAAYDLETGALRWEFRTVLTGDPYQTPWGTLIDVGPREYWQLLDRSGAPRLRLRPGGIASIDCEGIVLYRSLSTSTDTDDEVEPPLILIHHVSMIEGTEGTHPLPPLVPDHYHAFLVFTSGAATALAGLRYGAGSPERVVIMCSP